MHTVYAADAVRLNLDAALLNEAAELDAILDLPDAVRDPDEDDR
jgi:hypothetical protein